MTNRPSSGPPSSDWWLITATHCSESGQEEEFTAAGWRALGYHHHYFTEVQNCGGGKRVTHFCRRWACWQCCHDNQTLHHLTGPSASSQRISCPVSLQTSQPQEPPPSLPHCINLGYGDSRIRGATEPAGQHSHRLLSVRACALIGITSVHFQQVVLGKM